MGVTTECGCVPTSNHTLDLTEVNYVYERESVCVCVRERVSGREGGGGREGGREGERVDVLINYIMLNQALYMNSSSQAVQQLLELYQACAGVLILDLLQPWQHNQCYGYSHLQVGLHSN